MIADTSYSLTDQSIVYTPIAYSRVSLYSKTYDETYEASTDENGVVTFEKVISALYDVTIVDTIESGSYPKVVSANLVLDLTDFQDSLYSDTLIVKPVSVAPIVINEIFYGGSPSRYFYDQYIELYNPTNETQYLDGLIISTFWIKDTTTYANFAKSQYTYQFPGEPGGTLYPIQPGQHIVIAHDAMNHADSTNTAPLNLENADFEFFTTYDSKPDFDNPDVLNVVNINPNKDNDFFMNLRSGCVMLVRGDGWDPTPAADGYVYIPYDVVIDAVEYHYTIIDPSSKLVPEKLDAGYFMPGDIRYQQKAMERKQAGYDTDNSTHDFELVDPTPGSQHSGPAA